MAGAPQITEIPLAAPDRPGVTQVPITAGRIYVLQFPIETVTFEAKGSHLRIFFEDGNILEMRDFFTAARADDLFLRLEDGTMCLARDVVDIFLLDLQDIVCDSGSPAGILTDAGGTLDEALFLRMGAAGDAPSVGPAGHATPTEAAPATADRSATHLSSVPFSAPSGDEEAAISGQYILSLFS